MTNKTTNDADFATACRAIAEEFDNIVSFLQEEMKEKVFNSDEEVFKTMRIESKFLNKLAQRIKNEAIVIKETTING